MTNIVLLADYPQHRQQVINWLWQAFGSENSRAFFASVVDSGLRGADLPITFIALLGDELVGTVGLWRCDLISRQAGFNELYLYSDFSGYYERHGWHYIGDALDYPDRPVRLYHRELD